MKIRRKRQKPAFDVSAVMAVLVGINAMEQLDGIVVPGDDLVLRTIALSERRGVSEDELLEMAGELGAGVIRANPCLGFNDLVAAAVRGVH